MAKAKAKPKAKRSSSSTSSARSHSSGISINTNAPHSTTLIISVVIFLLGVLGLFVYIPVLSVLNVWLLFAGYLLLLAGCLAKGL
jgi:hypothetical protein